MNDTDVWDTVLAVSAGIILFQGQILWELGATDFGILGYTMAIFLLILAFISHFKNRDSSPQVDIHD